MRWQDWNSHYTQTACNMAPPLAMLARCENSVPLPFHHKSRNNKQITGTCLCRLDGTSSYCILLEWHFMSAQQALLCHCALLTLPASRRLWHTLWLERCKFCRYGAWPVTADQNGWRSAACAWLIQPNHHGTQLSHAISSMNRRRYMV